MALRYVSLLADEDLSVCMRITYAALDGYPHALGLEYVWA